MRLNCITILGEIHSDKARIHCEIFLSDSFMKHSLMYISLHLIWFHEIHIKYVKRKPPRLRKKEFKRSLIPAIKKETLAQVFSAKFLKTLFLQNTSGRLLLQGRKEKRLFLRKQGNSTKEHHIIPQEYVNFYQNTVSNFARLLGVCPPNYNPEHVNIPHKKANF